MKKIEYKCVVNNEIMAILLMDITLMPESHSSCTFYVFKEGSWYFVLSIEEGTDRCALEIFHPDGKSEVRIEVRSWVDMDQKPKKIAKLLNRVLGCA